MEIINLVTDLFKYNTGYLVKHLSKTDRSKLFIRPDQKSRPAIWLLGHIVVSRGGMVELLGGDPKTGKLNLYFNAGTKPLTDPSDYPGFDEILGQLGKLCTQLTRLLKEGGESLLNRQVWGQYDSIGKFIVSGYIHETYHVGQISYLLNLVENATAAKYQVKLSNKRRGNQNKSIMESLRAVLTVK